MSAYGGYSGGDESGGGYFAGGSQQGSQGGGGGGRNYQDESLRPVTVKQILEAEEAFGGSGDFKIDGQTVTQITAVGQVRNINPQPTNVTIRIDDGTGQLDVKKFVDIDKQHEATNPDFEINSHVRVWGRLKAFNANRYVGAHLIRPITDFNEVNYHMIESAYVHLYYTRGQPGQNGAAAAGDSMFVDGAGGGADVGGNAASSSKLSGCSANAKRMHNFMNNAPGGNEGIHLNVITNGTGMSVRDVLTAADELLGTGVIYTTVDDETWAILEY